MGELTGQEKFKRWVEVPLEALQQVPNGDGAMAALTMCFGLYERFVHSHVGSENTQRTPAFNEFAAKDLGCDVKTFSRFWDSYRVGMQHAFSPKNYVSKGETWGWDMASAKGYELYPQIVSPAKDQFVIKIDPWKFAAHTVERWKAQPELLDAFARFAFGNIAPVPEDERHPETAPGGQFSDRTFNDQKVVPWWPETEPPGGVPPASTSSP